MSGGANLVAGTNLTIIPTSNGTIISSDTGVDAVCTTPITAITDRQGSHHFDHMPLKHSIKIAALIAAALRLGAATYRDSVRSADGDAGCARGEYRSIGELHLSRVGGKCSGRVGER
jgi:hypothetical protein